MAHFVIYKRPTEVIPYTIDFYDLLGETDSALDTNATTIKVYDSAGADKTSYLLASKTFSGTSVSARFTQGLDGEDYLAYFDGVGDATTPEKHNQILEIRVRSKLAGSV